MAQAFQSWYQRHSRSVPAVFFSLGVGFDLLTLERIDSLITIFRQGVYLVLAGSLISLEFLQRNGTFFPQGTFLKIWRFREAATHFLLGGLLSVYTIFYFKSASLFTSFGFLIFLCVLLIANEFSWVRRIGVTFRVALFSLCLASYFIFVVPVLLGSMGTVPFLLAMAISILFLAGLSWLLLKKTAHSPSVWKQVVAPAGYTMALLLLSYFSQLLPPVPLAVTYMGVYHQVEKVEDRYHLYYTRPRWKFWERGDQSFARRPGDLLYGFVSIFSPTGFHEKIQVRWLYKDRGEWVSQDAIPIHTVGGRQEGFRGFTYKKNYQPGHWRFQVETEDGREIGRLYFRVSEDTSEEPRRLSKQIR